MDKIVLKGNDKGKAVAHHCPHTGPYTLTEQQSLLVWAGNAFTCQLISLEEKIAADNRLIRRVTSFHCWLFKPNETLVIVRSFLSF